MKEERWRRQESAQFSHHAEGSRDGGTGAILESEGETRCGMSARQPERDNHGNQRQDLRKTVI